MLSDYILSRRPVYMPYLTVGAPDFATTIEAAQVLAECGSDVLELGLPFSDPTADGPVIQAAMQTALSRSDFSLEQVFATIRACHERTGLPIVILTYSNPVLVGFDSAARDGDIDRQIRSFLEHSQQAGVAGLVVPDLPLDSPEGAQLLSQADKLGIAICPMVSPNMTRSRQKAILPLGSGFVYYMTTTGVTGEREGLPTLLVDQIQQLRTLTRLPLLAGFGINRPEQVQGWKSQVDGVIVGSMNHRILAGSGPDPMAELKRATLELVQALKIPGEST